MSIDDGVTMEHCKHCGLTAKYSGFLMLRLLCCQVPAVRPAVSDDKPLTPTPRVDANAFKIRMDRDEFEVVAAEDSRQLERELFEATQEAVLAHIGWTVRENEIARLKRELAEATRKAEVYEFQYHEAKRAAASAVRESVGAPCECFPDGNDGDCPAPGCRKAGCGKCGHEGDGHYSTCETATVSSSERASERTFSQWWNDHGKALKGDRITLALEAWSAAKRAGRCVHEGHVWVGIGDDGKVVCDDCGVEKTVVSAKKETS